MELPGSILPRFPLHLVSFFLGLLSPGCLFLVFPLPDSALSYVFLPWISSSCPLGLFCHGLHVLWSFFLWVSFLGLVLVVGPSAAAQTLSGSPTAHFFQPGTYRGSHMEFWLFLCRFLVSSLSSEIPTAWYPRLWSLGWFLTKRGMPSLIIL